MDINFYGLAIFTNFAVFVPAYAKQFNAIFVGINPSGYRIELCGFIFSLDAAFGRIGLAVEGNNICAVPVRPYRLYSVVLKPFKGLLIRQSALALNERKYIATAFNFMVKSFPSI